MRKYAAAFGLLAAVACGASSPTEPATSHATILAEQQGWLCSHSPGAGLASCLRVGATEATRRVPFRVDRGGILVAKVIYRDFDYEEYIRASLTCDGVNVPLVETEHLYGMSSPEWFRPLLGELWPAQRVTYSTAINRVCAYEFDLGFDLRSPPYSPFELTISVER